MPADVAVHVTGDRPSAETAASVLRAEGIPVRLDIGLEAAGHIPWARGHYTLFVPVDRLDEARELLGLRPEPPRQIDAGRALAFLVIGIGFAGLAAAIAYLVGVLIGDR